MKKLKKRKAIDNSLKTYTLINALLLVLVLGAILFVIIKNGIHLFKPSVLTTEYHSKVELVTLKDQTLPEEDFEDPGIRDTFFSNRWGISLKNHTKVDGSEVVIIVHIDDTSPFRTLLNPKNKIVKNVINSEIKSIYGKNSDGKWEIPTNLKDAEVLSSAIDKIEVFEEITLYHGGGGIKYSFLITLVVIALTVIIAVPAGVIVAIYLNEFAKETKFKKTLTTLIDMINGIPSIVFGLVGAVIFVPLVNIILKESGLSILAGVLTLAVIVQPVIISTTVEALKAVPDSRRAGSLALGASQSQTIFKVVLPEAKPGILTALLLSISRIIGESAALIFVMGSGVVDQVILGKSGTTLAVHIWSIMGDENPNIALASTISLIILLVILGLNLTIKLINNRIYKKKGLAK